MDIDVLELEKRFKTFIANNFPEKFGEPRVRVENGEPIFEVVYKDAIKGDDLFDYVDVEPETWEDAEADEEGYVVRSGGVDANFDEDHLMEKLDEKHLDNYFNPDYDDSEFEFDEGNQEYDYSNEIEVETYYVHHTNYWDDEPGYTDFELGGKFKFEIVYPFHLVK